MNKKPDDDYEKWRFLLTHWAQFLRSVFRLGESEEVIEANIQISMENIRHSVGLWKASYSKIAEKIRQLQPDNIK